MLLLWKAVLPRLLAFAQRHKGIIAVFGFVSGVASFLLVDRHEGFARVIAIVMLASWLWLIVEQTLRQYLAERFGLSVPTVLLRYATQMIHQESLFFVLPFLLTATTWDSGQAVFTGALLLATLVALVDPLYYNYLARRRWVFLTYHTLALFAVLLTALPLILRVPTGDSYKLALGVAVLLSFPSLAGSITVPTWWRKFVVIGLMLALAAFGWFARQWVPPATLWLTDVAISMKLDSAARAPSESLREISEAQLLANGLYAYTAINAPLGLREHVHHVWLHNGQEVDRIAIDIQGGRKEGYRAWTHKLNFPADPTGRWLVKVVTDTGQMIGLLRFRVVPDPPASSAPQ